MAKVAEVFIGARFGRLVVTGERTIGTYSRVPTRCDCGNEQSLMVNNLGEGPSKTGSCGCLHRERTAENSSTHRQSKTAEYNIWHGIVQRCTNPNYPEWATYGGRGITIFDGWRRSFVDFLSSVGPRPGPEYSIDRIDNDGNYEPGNVRWATRSEQRRNQRRWFVCKCGLAIEGANELITSSGGRSCRACFDKWSQEKNRRRRERRRVERDARLATTAARPGKTNSTS